MPGLRGRLLVEGWGGTWQRMTRTKQVATDAMDTPLNRCLSTLDITLLGIGHMVGAGIYVLTGTVAKDTAGPGIVLSFLLAGFASLLAALCYAEFGARVPKAGSAYVYTYVTIGEFWAFVIGWNIVLEHMIGAASVARAWSGYMDSLFDGALSNATVTYIGTLHAGLLAPYPDFLAFAVTLVYCGFLTLGVKGSAYFNSIFTLINLCVMAFVIVAGIMFADIGNWNTEKGFLPFGVSGVVAGAATCFYAFVGFDSIATAGEEAKDPAKSIPQATLVSMSVVTIGYIMVGATLTLMVPYYTLNPAAALPDAFAAHGANWAKYVVSVGAICGMTTTLFGSLFSLPRCVYAMAADGLLFSWLARVSDKTKVPVITLILCGFLSALIALVFDIEKLVEFMSIGTLMAYTIVSASVIILRYQPSSRCNIKSPSHSNTQAASTPGTVTTPTTPTSVDDIAKLIPGGDPGEGPEERRRWAARSCSSASEPESDGEGGELRSSCRWLLHLVGRQEAGTVATWGVVIFTTCSAALCSLLQWGGSHLALPYPSPWAVILALLLVAMQVFSVVVILAHRQNNLVLSFSVPLVPLLPLVSIFFNVALMVHLNPMTWIRFIVWMVLGLVLYFAYGQHHSREGEPVSSYSTLLTEPAPAGNTVFGSVQHTLSHVTAKIASAASEDKKPIVDESQIDDDDL
ncbi:cationic amino acid transporter 4-like isoform X1 [Penaeus chinensis]|uniref:cationic amino acid transporter 4-like isoform X1 n=1 Tax=Penaeus chinensis TaxID=139456 RepID=UPI001FB777EE|nr:cationic amino acid transporter 4-like isoform X1 [Penaeus chinensis]XP_047502914.1 cationic amino acid transporter 4-like isoform X1 [Penaeus chinensis]